MNSTGFDRPLIAMILAEFRALEPDKQFDAVMSLATQDRYLFASMIGKVLKTNTGGNQHEEQ